MSTYRFPLRAKVGVVGVMYDRITQGLVKYSKRTKATHRLYGPYEFYEPKPLSDEEVRNLPAAHRSSA